MCALIVACGTSESAPAGSPEPGAAELRAVSSGAQPVAASGSGSAETEAEEEPAAPVDLLRSVRTDLAVSTAYRNDVSQAAHLVDGNLETAWNSRSGDLVGAWIEVRLPATASVTSIGMTAGFTKRGDATDLFTGNHRVARVRVLRDGAEVAVLSLDPEARELQTLPVEGPGGVYRIEVAEVVAGSRSSWRETCVSELRIFGRDAGAQEGARFPRFAVGELPPPRPLPGSHDRGEVARRLADDARWLVRAWKELERDVQRIDFNTGEPEGEPEERAGLTRSRRAILTRTAELVELVDDVRADALRMAAGTQVDWASWRARGPALRADLDAIAPAFGAVAAWLGDDEAQCTWAKADIALRLGRIATRLETQRYSNEVGEAHGSGPESREEERTWNAIERGVGIFEGLERSWAGNPRAAAARLETTTMPDVASLAPDWEVVKAQLPIARARCGL